MSFRKISFFAACMAGAFAASAQTTLEIKEHKTVTIATPRGAVVNVKDIKDDYFPVIQRVEMPKPGMATEEDDAEMIRAKALVKPDPDAMRQQMNKTGSSLTAPYRLRNFEGNSYDGSVPDDNDIAVSNGGKIISAMNSTLNVYDSTGKLVKSTSLAAFSKSLGFSAGKYDPRLLYDPEADRFVTAFLNGFDDKSTEVILGFSQTNDPAGNWNLYAVSGNPLNDTTWSDYPIIALTKGELFLTLNALQDNKTWQQGFVQDYIWQIDKNSGYNGDTLKTKVHSGIVYNGQHIRNLCPVQGGSGLAGPECWFISDKNFSNKTDSIFLVHTSGLLSDPGNKVTVTLLHAKAGTYGMPPNAHQPSTAKVIRTLQTNDARVLDAFIENNTIQFVGNSVTAAGKSGAMHGIITSVNNNPSVSINILGDTLEFGYPAIAYAGIKTGDDDALIVVDHSADTTFPGNSALYYKNGSYSPSRRLYSGKTYAQISSKDERWGDYTGAQRKYNEPGKAWISAFYGRPVGSGINSGNGNGTRISEIQSPALGVPVGINGQQPEMVQHVDVYPVPAQRYTPVQVAFSTEEEQYFTFSIYDMQGRLVTRLMNEKVLPGKNIFTFSTAPLQKGIYFISISSKESEKREKFVVE